MAWPRAARAEAMLDRLVQLGAAAVTPLDARASGPKPPPKAGSLDRLERITRSALKQCRRGWMPRLSGAVSVETRAQALEGARVLVLDPAAPLALSDWLERVDAETFTPATPLVLAIGPEGGFLEHELELWSAAGAERVALHPHSLRIETAAEAALAVVTAHYHARSRRET